MKDRALLVTAVALGLAGALVVWALATASPGIRAGFDWTAYLFASFVVFVDALDIGLRVYFRRLQTGLAARTSVPLGTGGLTADERRLRLRPYALLVSLYNAETELDDFIETMAPYREKVWAIDDASTDRTALRLRQAGFRCLAGGINRKKPGAIRELLAALPPEIETVVVIDPDVIIHDSGRGALSDLETAVSDLQLSGMAAACPRITVTEDGWLARLQGLEYWLAFELGRKSLGDNSITSGIALYRRAMLERLLARHSLSVYAEDLENSLLLLGDGERVYYDGALVIETFAQRTWRGWLSQRVGWSYGLIRAYLECFREVRRGSKGRFVTSYHYLVYTGLLTLLLHPLKLLSLVVLAGSAANAVDGLFGLGWIADTTLTYPGYFLAGYLKYSLLTLAALFLAVGRGDRARLAPVVPIYFFYALLQLIPTTIGFANWASLRLARRRLFRDHYQDEAAFGHAHGRATARMEMERTIHESV